MTERRFRILLVVQLVVSLASIVAGLALSGLLPVHLAEAYESSPETLFEQQPWSWAVAAAVLVAGIAGYVGLFLWRAWGRRLSLWSTVVGFALYPLFGPTVQSWAEATFADVSSMLWGAVLALAYFSPVSHRFGANNSSKPTPLRGAA